MNEKMVKKILKELAQSHPKEFKNWKQVREYYKNDIEIIELLEAVVINSVNTTAEYYKSLRGREVG